MLSVLLYEPTGPFDVIGLVIAARTRSRYSHVAIAFDDVLYEAVRTGVRRLRGPVAMRRIAQASALRTFQPEPDDQQRATRWIDGQVGNPYEPLEILGILLSLIVARNCHWICSSLSAAVCRIAGVLTSEDDDRLYTPASLAAALGIA